MKEYGHEYADFVYYTPSAFERMGGIWPIRSGRNIAKANYAVGTRMIECYSIHFVLNGVVDFNYGEGEVRLHEGDLFCLFPGMKNCYRAAEFNTMSPLRMHWFAFDGPQANHLLQRIGITEQHPYLRGKVTGEIGELLSQNFGWLKEDDRELDIQQSIYRLFARLSSPASAEPKKESDWLSKCEAYISNHYMEPITIADVARISGIHRSHLYSAFNRVYGMSPKHYLSKKRMDKAVDLLMNGPFTVTEISHSLGYSDLYSFSRAFFNYFGVSPSSYRKQQEAVRES